MGIRNKKQETLRRLDSKTLDAGFLNEIRNGVRVCTITVEYAGKKNGNYVNIFYPYL